MQSKESNYSVLAHDVWVSLKKKQILKSVSLTLKNGECLALLGPSGSGKTTLLRSIAGFVRQLDQGQIKVGGAKVQDSEGRFVRPAKRDCVLLFQDLALWPHLSAIDHLKFPYKASFEKNKPSLDELYDILSLLDIGKKANSLPSQLSGGEKQRLALARALACKPSCLLLDEPFSSLDLVLKSEMIMLLKELKTSLSLSIIHVTHDPYEAYHLADKILVLKDGQVSWAGSVSEFSCTKAPEIAPIKTAAQWMRVPLSGASTPVDTSYPNF